MYPVESHSHDWEKSIGKAFNARRDNELQHSGIKIVDAAALLADEYNDYGLMPEELANLKRAVKYITTLASQEGMKQPEIKVKYSGSSIEAGYNRIWLSRGNLQRLDWDSLEVRIAHELAHVKNKDALKGEDGQFKDSNGETQGPADANFYHRTELEADATACKMLDDPKKMRRALIRDAKDQIDYAKAARAEGDDTILRETLQDLTAANGARPSIRERIRQARTIENDIMRR